MMGFLADRSDILSVFSGPGPVVLFLSPRKWVQNQGPERHEQQSGVRPFPTLGLIFYLCCSHLTLNHSCELSLFGKGDGPLPSVGLRQQIPEWFRWGIVFISEETTMPLGLPFHPVMKLTKSQMYDQVLKKTLNARSFKILSAGGTSLLTH